MKTPHIAIIGAGIAGLTCGYRLRQQGLDVHLYEARKRVGGRVFTAQVNGQHVELGGMNLLNLYNGVDTPIVRKIAAEMRLPLLTTTHDLDPYVNGPEGLIRYSTLVQQRNLPRNQDLYNLLAKLCQGAFSLGDVLDGLLHPSELLHQTLNARLHAYEGAEAHNLSPIYCDTLYHALMGGIAAALPAPDTGPPTVTYLTVACGNSRLPLALAESLSNRVHIEMPLMSIAKNYNGTYQLHFANGKETQAHIVVLSMPCSVYSDIKFDAGVIPLEQLAAIKDVRYGTNAKIIVPYHGTVPRQPIIHRQCISFFANTPNLLNLYLLGSQALFSSDSIHSVYKKELPFLAKAYDSQALSSVIPSLADDQMNSSYAKAIGYSWSNDPYAKGSYSFIGPGQEKIMTSISEHYGEKGKSLFAPINDSIFFAGEHASILEDAHGTIEAACESGERCARQIIRLTAMSHVE